MALDIKEDLKKIKEFKDGYKKCKVVSAKDAKEAEDYAKKIKYFGHDMRMGLEVLEEVIAEKKTDPEAIKSKKIEDYAAVYKEVREILKDIKFNLAKVVDAAKNLEKLEKSADVETCKKKLNELLKDIQLDTKNRKKGKPEKIVAKLQKQIEADLKVVDNYHPDIKKILPNHPKLPDYEKEYNKEVQSIAIIKPRLSSRTQKYIKLAPQFLTPKVLKKAVADCEKASADLKAAIEKAKKGAQESNDKDLAAGVREADKAFFGTIKKIGDQYTKILKKYGPEIGKSANEKVINKATTAIDKIWDDSDTLWDDAKKAIDKIKKDQKNQAKKA